MEEQQILSRLDAQLKLLQQRNLQWAQETVALLDDEVRQAQAPLEAEIDELHHLIQELTVERNQLAHQLQSAEESANQRLQQLSEQITHNIQEVLGQGLPQPLTPPKPIVVYDIPIRQRPKVPLKPLKPKRKPLAHHPMLKPLAAVAVLVALGYLGLTHLPKHLFSSSNVAAFEKVAGVSTAKPQLPQFQSLNQEYPQSYATVSFANTVWATYADSDFGISIDYPKNATNIVHEVGGDNLWFLRNDGYLMKISKIDITSSQSLDAWWTANQNEYITDTPASQSTFAGTEAWFIPSSEKTTYSGSTYFIKEGAEVYQIWVKDEPTTTDDGQRLQKMIASLQFS